MTRNNEVFTNPDVFDKRISPSSQEEWEESEEYREKIRIKKLLSLGR